MYDADIKSMLELSLDSYAVAYYMDDEDLEDKDEVFEHFEDLMDGLTEQEAKLSVEEVEDMDEDDFDDIVETLVDKYDYDEDAIEDAKIVTVKITLEYDGDKIILSNDETVVCIDGNWYMLGRTILAESIASEAVFAE